jgi:circadian clock protein KaiB
MITGPPEWVSAPDPPRSSFVLRLFVSGMTHFSQRAIASARAICEEHLPGRYSLEIVDITRDNDATAAANVIATPTLVREQPLPLRRLVGDLSRSERVLAGLGIQGVTPS